MTLVEKEITFKANMDIDDILRISIILTHINHDQASGLEDVSSDGVEEDFCLKTDVNLHR